MVTAATIALALLITGIFWIRRRVDENRMDEMDDERVAHRAYRVAEDDEL